MSLDPRGRSRLDAWIAEAEVVSDTVVDRHGDLDEEAAVPGEQRSRLPTGGHLGGHVAPFFIDHSCSSRFER